MAAGEDLTALPPESARMRRRMFPGFVRGMSFFLAEAFFTGMMMFLILGVFTHFIINLRPKAPRLFS